MQKSKYAILAGAVMAVSPLVGKAVTMTFQYDPNDIMVNGVGASFTGTSSAPTLVVAQGATISIGVDVDVTADPNSTLAYHGVYDSGTGSHHYIQPQNLGIAAFGMGFNTSSQAIAPFDPADNGNVGINPDFSTPGTGTFDSNNNVTIGSVAGGNLAATLNSANTSGAAALGYGGATYAELFNSLLIDTAKNGTATITPTGIADNNFGYVAYNSGGTSTSSKPVYKNITMTATDTIGSLPALTIIVGPTVVLSQPIISLVPGSVPPTTYGSQDGSLTLTGKGSGSYNVAVDTALTPATTGYIPVTGFTPGTDTEIYALKLTSNGTAISGTQIATVIADINGANGNTAAVGVTASAVTGVYTTLFPGYEILLTSTGTTALNTSDEFAFDFSSGGEQDSAVPGLVVTGVAAVPEPATAAGVVMGAAGLLLGRRKNRLTVA